MDSRHFNGGPGTVTPVEQLPDEAALAVLHQNYPNPFNPSTTIALDNAHSQHLVLKIYDVRGRVVATPLDKIVDPGRYEVLFDGRELASGVYFYRLIGQDFQQTRKFTLTK